MKRLSIPLILLLTLAFACNFGQAAPTATPIPIQPATSTPLPPTAAAATDLPATVAPATETTAPAEPTATFEPAALSLKVVARLSDGSLHILDSGFGAAGIPLNQGLLPAGGAAGEAAYVLNFASPASAQRLDAAGTTELPFVNNVNYGLAVWQGDRPALLRLAWGTQLTGDPATTQLVIAEPNPGGFDVTPVVTETVNPADPPYQLVAERWSDDGQHLYFSREPVGIGGYIPFAGASSVYRYDLADHSVTELLPFAPNGGRMICLDDLNADFSLAAGSCGEPQAITVADLNGGPDRVITAPGTVTDFRLVGSARFSPDGQRLAFALAKGSPDDEQGYVAISDGLEGASNFVATTDPGSYYTVLAWLDPSTLLLQLNSINCTDNCEPSLWTIGIGGDGLTEIGQGIFLALMAGS